MEARSTRTVGPLVGALLIGFLMAGCGHVQTGSAPGNDIPVGAILPLSGENASFGTSARTAYEIAEADRKAAGLNVLRVIYGDSRLDKDLAMKEFTRITDLEHVVAFVETTGSGVALALAPLAAQKQVPIVSGINSSPELTMHGGPYFFRVIPSDAYSGEVLSHWTKESGLESGVLVFNQQNGWATGFKSAIAEAYARSGGSLPPASIVPVGDDTVNFSSAIIRLKSSSPKVWFVGLMGRQAGLFVKQAVGLGVKGPFLGVDNLAQSEFVSTAGEAAQYAKLALPAEIQSAKAKSFMEKYKQKQSRDADAIALKAYDAYWTLADAIKRTTDSGKPVTGSEIRLQLEKTRLDGLTGQIEFDEKHDLKSAVYERFGFTSAGKRVKE